LVRMEGHEFDSYLKRAGIVASLGPQKGRQPKPTPL